MPLNSFKNMDEIFKPDKGNYLSFEEYYHEVANISLNIPVPQEIREHFDIAINLMLYSWFVRRFKHVVELHAFSSVEFAIRTKIKIATPEKSKIKNLGPLLKYAIQQKWITDNGFPEIVEKKKQRKIFKKMIEDGLGINLSVEDEIDNDIQELSKTLIKLLPTLRNIFAHGSNTLLNSYLELLSTCRYIINQIFYNGRT
jgi:hypothetical protein